VTDVDDYLSRNRQLAPRFIGRRVRSVVRLRHDASDDDVRFEWGRALVELDDGNTFLFDCEESLSNVIVFEMPSAPDPPWDAQASMRVRPAIATVGGPLGFMLDHDIVAIDAISRRAEPDPGMRRYSEMCGWRVEVDTGRSVFIGTNLTESNLPGTGFYLADEIDPKLHYSALARRPGMLISTGFFRELRHGNPASPSLREAIQPTPQPDEARIVSYLKSGKPLVITMGLTRDVLIDNGPIIGPPHVLTDGVYAWPADLAHYAAKHHARVDAGFVAHMRANAWMVPTWSTSPV